MNKLKLISAFCSSVVHCTMLRRGLHLFDERFAVVATMFVKRRSFEDIHDTQTLTRV